MAPNKGLLLGMSIISFFILKTCINCKTEFQTVLNVVTIGEICERYSEQIIFFRKVGMQV